jgi:hypothetical protein
MEVLLSAAQNHDAKILPTTRSQTRRANTHSSFPTESYDEEKYNIDTSIDTIWVNAHHSVLAHYSNNTRVSDDAWSKLPQDSQNIWMSLPIDDWKLILGASDSVSSITKTSSSTPSRSGFGRGRRTFARNHDKRKVMFTFSAVIQSTPLRQAYGTDNDISPMLYFSFYEPVYYLVDETTFPSESKELRRRWVGVS